MELEIEELLEFIDEPHQKIHEHLFKKFFPEDPELESELTLEQIVEITKVSLAALDIKRSLLLIRGSVAKLKELNYPQAPLSDPMKRNKVERTKVWLKDSGIEEEPSEPIDLNQLIESSKKDNVDLSLVQAVLQAKDNLHFLASEDGETLKFSEGCIEAFEEITNLHKDKISSK